MEKNRNFGLDVMRAIAVIMVLLYHWIGGNLMELYPDKIQYFGLLGYYGVEIFFVLSGFLIGNIIIRSFLNEEKYNLKTILNFWTRRWLRTIPLYYFIFLFFLGFAIYKKEVTFDVWKYVFFIQNIFEYNTHNNNFYGVSWSLSVEEWFYLSFPVILIAANTLLRKVMTRSNIILSVVLFYLFFGLGMRIVYINVFNSISWNEVLRKAVICREDSIAFGVLAAWIINERNSLFKNYTKIFAIIGVILLVIGAMTFLNEVADNYYYGKGELSFFSKTLLFSTVNFGVLLTLPFCYYINVNSQWIKRPVTHISKISYSLYLTHLFAFHVVHKLLPGKLDIKIIGLSLICFLGLSIVVANITYRLIEVTFLNLRNRITQKEFKPV